MNDETVRNFVIVYRAKNNYYWAEIWCKNCKTIVYTSSAKDKDQQKIIDKLKSDIGSFELNWLIHLMSCPQYQEKTK